MALWTPNALPNVKFGLIGSAPANTLVSGKLSVAADTSGNGFPATAASSAFYALLTTLLNGLAVISGNNTTERAAFELLTAQGMSNNVSAMSTFLVNRDPSPTTVSDNPIVHFSKNGATNTRYTLSRATAGAGDVTLGVRRLDTDGFTQITTGTNHGSGWLVISAQCDYAGGTGQIWVNGTSGVSGALGSGGGNTSPTNSQVVGLGEYDSTGGGSWVHDEAEVWHVIGILSSADRLRMEGYLAWKYGLQANLDPSSPYLAAAPQLADNAATESSAGTDTVNRTVALPRAATETSAGTDAANRTVALARAQTETSAGTDTQDQTGGGAGSGTFGTTESTAGTDTNAQTNTGGTFGTTESTAGTDTNAQTGGQAWGTVETSAGTDTVNRSLGNIARGVTETSLGGTTQTGTKPAPVTTPGASGMRRALIQSYTDYFERKKLADLRNETEAHQKTDYEEATRLTQEFLSGGTPKVRLKATKKTVAAKKSVTIETSKPISLPSVTKQADDEEDDLLLLMAIL